jgi:Fur family transcriptional regulator, ferric uptake regulator
MEASTLTSAGSRNIRLTFKENFGIMQPGADKMSCFTTLKRKGLRLTPQRRMIVDIIHDRGDHLTAEDLIAYVREKMPEVDKSTVYRTLDLLEETGCVYKSKSGNEILYHHAEEGCHHHLVCQKCGKTVDLEEDLFLPVEKILVDKYNFRVNLQHMVIQGLCANCKTESG